MCAQKPKQSARSKRWCRAFSCPVTTTHRSRAIDTKKIKTVADLLGADAVYNPRKIDNEGLARLKKTIESLGDLSGIVINLRTGNLVSGHQRKKVLPPESKITKRPVKDSVGTVAAGTIITPDGREYAYREVDWGLDLEMAANLAANEGAGDWDFAKRVEILEKLDSWNFDLDLTGHSNEQIELMFAWTPEDTKKLSDDFTELAGASNKPDTGNQSAQTSSKQPAGGEPTKEPRHPVLKDKAVAPEQHHDDELIQVHFNLSIDDVEYLDKLYEEYGLRSRSMALRMLIQERKERVSGQQQGLEI